MPNFAIMRLNKSEGEFMKKVVLLGFSILFLAGSTLYAGAKRYNIKSGLVSYHTSTSGSIMGFGTQAEGSKTIYFKEYGNVEVQEATNTSTTMGKQESTHTLTKFHNGMIYSVDFDHKTIIKQDMSTIMGDKNMQAMGQDMLEKMGGKKIGSGKVLGYNCEVWEAMGGKMWFYKGVPLKMESSMMGIKTTEIATKASFNKNIPNAKFKLPQYPVQTMDNMLEQKINRPDAQGNKPNPEQLQQVQDMLKGLGGLFGGQ